MLTHIKTIYFECQASKWVFVSILKPLSHCIWKLHFKLVITPSFHSYKHLISCKTSQVVVIRQISNIWIKIMRQTGIWNFRVNPDGLNRVLKTLYFVLYANLWLPASTTTKSGFQGTKTTFLWHQNVLAKYCFPELAEMNERHKDYISI